MTESIKDILKSFNLDYDFENDFTISVSEEEGTHLCDIVGFIMDESGWYANEDEPLNIDDTPERYIIKFFTYYPTREEEFIHTNPREFRQKIIELMKDIMPIEETTKKAPNPR